MGCCMSTQQASSSSSPHQPPPAKRRRLDDPVEESLAKVKDDSNCEKTKPQPPPPPPPRPLPLLYVEEKVKGVLIETPFTNPKVISSIKPPQSQTLNPPKPKPFKTPAVANIADQKWSTKTKTTPRSPSLSQAPPPPSPLSTASMSPARSAPKRERVAGQSPTRKPGFLYPGRVNGGLVKMVQSRDSGAVVSKPDTVLGPWKRSGSSPVARVSNIGVGRPVAERGSSAAGRRNSSPGRVTRDRVRKGKCHAGNIGQVNGKDSLESPLVSLECFIFL